MEEISEVESGALELLRDELSLLGELDEALGATLDLHSVAELVLDYVLDAAAADGGAIVLGREGRELLVQETRGDARALASNAKEALARLREADSTVLAAISHGDAEPEEAVDQIVAPIRFQQKIAGVVVLTRSGPEPFTVADVERVIRLVRHASAGFASALLHRDLIAANEASLAFVSTITHELKTPLAAIRGYSDLIHSGLTGEISSKQRRFLESINRNVTRTTTYIQNLADISRLEAGQLDVLAETTSFENVIQDAVRAVQADYDEKGVRLHVDIPPALAPVLGDDFRLVQVLTNLLSNACNYSPPEADVYLMVRADVPDSVQATAVQLPSGPLLYCAVRDTGYGISAEDQRRLFTKFFRSTAANIRQTPGGGLGLALSRGIVALHGGALWCESTLDEGSTFHLAIPRAT
jgi:signal transduction histidine kinase